MKKICFLVCLLVVWLGTTNVFSQISQGGVPKSFKIGEKTQLNEIPTVVMPYVDVESLRKEDEYYDRLKDRPWRFGQNIEVEINPQNSGVWDILDDGSKLWRVWIVSPGAVSLNFTFDRYKLPKGAELFLYTPDRKNIIGAFTDFNNREDGYFATILLPGDQVIIEYYEPANVEFPGELNLWRVTHGYRGVKEFAKDFGEAGSCNVNVACPQSAGWENQIRSVAMLVTGGSGFCTGALINNTNNDGTPYFLSANHCYTNPATVVFWFNWQSATCQNPATSPSYQSISGATDKAKYSNSDFWLMQLSSAPPQNFNPYYAGWNRTTDNSITGTVVGIHHPSGDIKKISWSNGGVTTTSYSGTTVPGDGTHWRVTSWSDGTTTEGGSSGSPLFDPQGRIIGQLHGGSAACGNTLSDWYGKLGKSWTGGGTDATRLSTWLDPANTGVMTLDGFDPYLVTCTPPTQQATQFSSSNIGDNQMTISWQRGNGDQVLVLAKQGSAITVNPYNGQTYTANSIFGQGSQISGAYVVYKGTGSSVTVTGLLPGTTYHYAIYEFKTTDNCYLTPGLTGNATTTGTAPCTYCTVSANTDDATGVTSVTFNTINNTSAGDPAYTDFRNISTNVIQGQAYNLSVKVNTAGNYTVYTKAWIDWNQNCQFETSEEYDLGTAVNVTSGLTSLSPKSITVPSTATLGSTVMRIRATYNTAALACGNQNWSETEDYTIVVVSSQYQPPTNLTAQVQNKNVILNWTAPSQQGLTGFKVFRNNNLITTIDQASTTTYTDQNLNPGTYVYYVKALYGSDESGPSNNATAVIPCDAIATLPYSTSFEGNFPPDCWTIQQTSANTWEQVSSFTTSGTSPITVNPQDGQKFAVVKWLATNQNEMLISPVFDLSNYQNISLSFWFNGSYYWSVENNNCNLDVLVRTNGGQWTKIWDETNHPNFTSSNVNYTWLNTVLDLQNYNQQANFQFAFRYTGNDGANFSVDNVVLSGNLVNLKQTSQSYNVFPNPTTGSIYINNAQNSKYRLMDMNGKVLKTGTIDNSNYHLDLNSHKGLYILQISNNDNWENHKILIH